MISIQRIQTQDVTLYHFSEKLLTTAFPKEERREFDQWHLFTDSQPLFHNNIVLLDGQPIGLLTYWDFEIFNYVEHFAIAPENRNGGIGFQVIKHFQEQVADRPIVLEVESPTNEMSKRRIGFYQRLDFVLWDKQSYGQPPYRKGGHYLPMFLMVNGVLCPDQDFQRVKEVIYKEVYGVKEAE